MATVRSRELAKLGIDDLHLNSREMVWTCGAFYWCSQNSIIGLWKAQTRVALDDVEEIDEE